MTSTTKPDRQLVREWMDRRAYDNNPPPTPAEIREQLGWTIAEAEREERDRQERSE